MNLHLHAITIDCADPYRLADFWSQALGRPLHPEDRPGDPEALIRLPQGPPLLFLRVPEPKTTKNRIHLDVCAPPGSTRDQETQRLLTLGATLIDDRRTPDGTGWPVLADPEGNEFCVVNADHER